MDLSIGDRITIVMCESDDPDLVEWINDECNCDEGFYINDIDEDQHMCWIENCPYGISLDIVKPFEGINAHIFG